MDMCVVVLVTNPEQKLLSSLTKSTHEEWNEV